MTERFTLLDKVGRGGMGVVWRARDEATGQIVALKLLHAAYADDPSYVTRFERELELARRIKSRNVVGVMGYGVREGTPYLALEYVDGPSLRERLKSHGPYSWSEARALLIEIARGLADAHAAGVIHRDLKPSNVLIGADGVPKIADFGIARGIDLTRVTGTSTLLGTPAYLAPEGPKDERSDLYSLGVVAYELLSGVAPFAGTTYQEVIVRHIREAPDLTRLPVQARPIVGRLLAKDSTERPSSARALLTLLGDRGPVPVPATPAALAAAAPAAPAPARPRRGRRAAARPRPAAAPGFPIAAFVRRSAVRLGLAFVGFVALVTVIVLAVALLRPAAPGATVVRHVVADGANVISAYGDRTCAIREDRSLVCWGDASEELLDPPGWHSYTTVAVGPSHACAIDTFGSVLCWGYPVDETPVEAPSGVYAAVGVGLSHDCAISDDLAVVCWPSFTLDTSRKYWLLSVSDGDAACAVGFANQLDCWAMGDGDPYGIAAAAPKPGSSSSSPGFRWASISGTRGCAIDAADRSMRCWGEAEALLGEFDSVSVGDTHSCAIGTDGRLTCWGGGNLDIWDAPAGSYVAVTVGRSHSCAVTTDHELVCWGDNSKGQLDIPNAGW